nr:P-loop nucleoside triphosphate hydrolases superfamily protein with CH (Calponin Homology) domain-containing protein [Tanacetum cinerariifolium]
MKQTVDHTNPFAVRNLVQGFDSAKHGSVTGQILMPCFKTFPSLQTDLMQNPVKEVSDANLVRDMFMFDKKREGQLVIKQFLVGFSFAFVIHEPADPYRQAKTLMFIHVSPDPDTVAETVTTLNFAERVSTVKLGTGKLNNYDGGLKKLKEQVAFLKATLANKEGDGQDSNIDGGDDEDGAASESSEADS